MSPELAAAAEAVLREQGPIEQDALAAALVSEGLVDADEIDDVLLDLLDMEVDGAAQLLDDRWIWAPAVLRGRVFTHRLDDLEVTHDVIYLDPDLAAIPAITGSGRHHRLADGSEVIEVIPFLDGDLLDERGVPPDALDDNGGLLLEPGWLRGIGVTAGDVIGVRLTASGLAIERIDAALLDPSAAVDEALAPWFHERETPLSLEHAVLTVCVSDPTVFRDPVVPLAHVFDALGMATEGDLLASPGFDLGAWRVERRQQGIAKRHDLDDDEALAVLATVSLYERVAHVFDLALDAADEPDAPDEQLVDADPLVHDESEAAAMRETLAFLEDTAVAAAVVEEIRPSREDRSAAAFGLFAETLEPMAPRAAKAVLRWMRGKAYETVGDTAEAEKAYLAAETLDRDCQFALVDLARFASDRGDAERGLALLRRAGAEPDHPLLELLARFQSVPRTDIGRNHPCWCGSGRKYKQCHLRNEQVPLDERAGWLYQKAAMALDEPDNRDALVEVALERSQYSDSAHGVAGALADPLVGDAVLFEGGILAEFLAVRGSLLPDDERSLAEQWLLIPRSLYEVEAVHPGASVVLRDVRTGDVHEVRERTASRTLRVGQLVCTHVLPTGDTRQMFGGVEPVSLGERDELMELLDDDEADPVEIVAFLTRRFAPTQMRNTEGDPIIFCETTLRTTDPDALAHALDLTYSRSEDGEQQWFEYVTTHGEQRLRATLTLAARELRVETNSAARQDRVLATVLRLDPSATVVDQSRRPARDAREVQALAASMPGSAALEPDDPAVAAALADYVRQYETKWLDESIPALSGRTPREAAADPTRRPDLVRLLDSFPPAVGTGSMDPDRLRAALGL